MLTRTLGMEQETIEQTTEYDPKGRVTRSSQPHFVGETKLYTSMRYDALDRPIETTLPHRATSTQAYTVNTSGQSVTTATNDKGRTKTSYANALGETVKIVDAKNNAVLYEYDTKGNLTKTTGKDNQGTGASDAVTRITYDKLGRRLTLIDQDLGTSRYTYNAYGELLTQTDALNQTLTNTYDKLGRLETRSVPGTALKSGGTSTWTYE